MCILFIRRRCKAASIAYHGFAARRLSNALLLLSLSQLTLTLTATATATSALLIHATGRWPSEMIIKSSFCFLIGNHLPDSEWHPHWFHTVPSCRDPCCCHWYCRRRWRCCCCYCWCCCCCRVFRWWRCKHSAAMNRSRMTTPSWRSVNAARS